MDDNSYPIRGLTQALNQLPVRMDRALRLFRKITRLTAVSSVASRLPEPGAPLDLPPPLHPRCAVQLDGVSDWPCGEQWKTHLQKMRRSQSAHSHLCSLGLSCTCITIRLAGQPVGVVKLVVDRDTPEPVVATATSVLALAVSGTCLEVLNSVLTDETRDLQQQMASLLRAKVEGASGIGFLGPSASEQAGRDSRAGSLPLAERAVECLQRHYREHGLSMKQVAAELGCNPRYLAGRFAKIKGEQMHVFLLRLRVDHARRLLLETDLAVKEVAHASGFRDQGLLARAFRRRVGVSPIRYRSIFARPRSDPDRLPELRAASGTASNLTSSPSI